MTSFCAQKADSLRQELLGKLGSVPGTRSNLQNALFHSFSRRHQQGGRRTLDYPESSLLGGIEPQMGTFAPCRRTCERSSWCNRTPPRGERGSAGFLLSLGGEDGSAGLRRSVFEGTSHNKVERAGGVAEAQTLAGETMQAALERVLGAKLQLVRPGEIVAHMVREESFPEAHPARDLRCGVLVRRGGECEVAPRRRTGSAHIGCVSSCKWPWGRFCSTGAPGANWKM